MAKRRAGVELTQENWDQEDKKEEAGQFTIADEETLSKRPIIKARRRVAAQQEGEQSQTPFSAFKGFTGFGNTPNSTQPSTSSSFKPVSSSKSSTKSQSLGGSGISTSSSQSLTTFSFKPAPSSTETPSTESKPTFSFKPSTDPQTSLVMSMVSKSETDSKLSCSSNGNVAYGNNKASTYATELKALNQSVAAWIKKHVDSNPVCDLSPIFDDYKKHLSEIEQRQELKSNVGRIEAKVTPQVSSVNQQSSSQGKSSSSATSFTGFKFSGSFGKSGEDGDTSKKDVPTAKEGFTFGASDNKGFTFGSSGSSSLSSTGTFSFGAQSNNGQEKKLEQEENYEPPKAEVKVIEEKDSLFSTRCKVFYKKGSEFKERGVGMLHVKDSGGSGQILVRADTSLGNVILNIGISSSMVSHFTKQGKNKNNVMLLSPLNPPADKKCPKCNKNYISPQESTACEGGCSPDPTPLLLRVKTETDADNIIQEIKKIFKD